MTVGSNCSISMYSVIYTASHYLDSPAFQYYAKPTSIGDCCWLGTRCVIMPGSRLENGSVVSVNSVFKGTAKANGVYIGNPAELRRERKRNEPYQLKNRYYFV